MNAEHSSVQQFRKRLPGIKRHLARIALKHKVSRIIADFSYAVKVIKCAFSRYQLLQWQSNDGWEACGLRLDPHEGGALYPHYDLETDAYYVCALFENGAHIPLPLILGEYHDVGPLQRAALRLTQNCRSMLDALVDCAYYDNQYRDEIADW